MYTLDNQDTVLRFFNIAANIPHQPSIVSINAARFQRTPKCPNKSTRDRRDQIVDRGRVRL